MALVHQLPRLLLIADRFTDPSVAVKVVEAVHAGLPWVQLRDHAASEEAFREGARELIRQIREDAPDTVVSINGRMEAAMDFDTGIHIGKRGPTAVEASRHFRGSPVGYSVHSLEEAGSVAARAPDYFLFSPVFATRSKPGAAPAGLDGLREISRRVGPLPVIALGGVTPGNVRECLQAGASGVAVLSGIMAAEDVGAAVAEYRCSLAARREIDHP